MTVTKGASMRQEVTTINILARDLRAGDFLFEGDWRRVLVVAQTVPQCAEIVDIMKEREPDITLSIDLNDLPQDTQDLPGVHIACAVRHIGHEHTLAQSYGKETLLTVRGVPSETRSVFPRSFRHQDIEPGDTIMADVWRTVVHVVRRAEEIPGLVVHMVGRASLMPLPDLSWISGADVSIMLLEIDGEYELATFFGDTTLVVR